MSERLPVAGLGPKRGCHAGDVSDAGGGSAEELPPSVDLADEELQKPSGGGDSWAGSLDIEEWGAGREGAKPTALRSNLGAHPGSQAHVHRRST